MKGFHSNIEKDTLKNENFRKVLYTSKHIQLVLMNLKPGEDFQNLPMKVGKTVLEMISNDNDVELDAVKAYNNAIILAREVSDQGIADLLINILKEEGHIDWAEIQRAQIEQMGIENYLVNQIDSPAS